MSNLGTANYETATCLPKLFSPLSKSEYTINNTKQFVNYIGKQKIPDGYRMVSSLVTSLFTNLPLKETFEIILRRIYMNKEINTNIPKSEMRELLTTFFDYYICVQKTSILVTMKYTYKLMV